MTRAGLPLVNVACCAPLVREPLEADAATDLAQTLKAIADPARLRLLSLIAAHEGGEACVCDLTEPLGLTQPTVSHHLKVLVDAGLLHRDKARGLGVLHPGAGCAGLARRRAEQPRSGRSGWMTAFLEQRADRHSGPARGQGRRPGSTKGWPSELRWRGCGSRARVRCR